MSEIGESEDRAKVETDYYSDLEENGFCVLEDILSAGEVFDIRNKLLAAGKMVPERGLEPPTNCLRSNCSTN